MRKETTDGPHIGRRYFQCTDQHKEGDEERFVRWFDKKSRSGFTKFNDFSLLKLNDP